MGYSSFPTAYRTGAFTAGFRGGLGGALGVGAAAGVALLSAHPGARGSLGNAIGNIPAPSFADAGALAAGAAAGFAAQALLTAGGALLRKSPWVLAAMLALELLNRWRQAEDIAPGTQVVPSNYVFNCGGPSGRLYNAAIGVNCGGAQAAIVDADPKFGVSGALTISWQRRVGTHSPISGWYVQDGRATRVVAANVRTWPGRQAGQRPWDVPKARTAPKVRSLDPASVKPGEQSIGDMQPIPYPVLPIVGTNPFRPPFEQRMRGNRRPLIGEVPGDRPIRRVIVDAYAPVRGRNPGQIIDGVIVAPSIPDRIKDLITVPPAVKVWPKPTSRGRVVAPAHAFARPFTNVREHKIKMSIPPGSASTAVNIVTETGDFIDAFWEAIPIDYRYGYNWSNTEDKVRAIFEQWNHLDKSRAILNLVVNQAGDAVYGAAGKAQAQANQTFGFIRSPLWMSALGR